MDEAGGHIFVATSMVSQDGNVAGVRIHPECAAGSIAAAGAFGLGLAISAGVAVVVALLGLGGTKTSVEASAEAGPTAGDRAAAAGFRRSETAIVVHRRRIGLSSKDPDHHTANDLAKCLGVDPSTVANWITRGWLPATKRGTERTPQQGGDQWWIHRSAVRRFIVDHAAVVDLRKVDRFWFIDLLAGPA